MPRFSIIIPAYNAEGHIRKCLDSIKQQTFKDYELIVVCDSCLDRTEKIAKEYGARTFNVKYHNDGLTRSKGLDLATGDWVLFLDDDDWWLHEYVLWQIDQKLTELKKNVDVLCFSFIFKDIKYATPEGNNGERWIAVWNKCWRRSAIGGTRFPNVKMCSDRHFHREMVEKNLKWVDWDMPIYYYNWLRKGSQSEVLETQKEQRQTQQQQLSKTKSKQPVYTPKVKPEPKYIIHACPNRMGYVSNFLLPSLLEQGIKQQNIQVFNDRNKLGNLRAFLESIKQLPDDNSGTWHLQDDIVISKWFKKRTEQYDDGLACGYCSSYSEGMPPGIVGVNQLWYSFPCIRIPNVLAYKFLDWFYQKATKNPSYQHMIRENKFDDELFKIFIQTEYPNLRLRNISPNLVDHVDYLLGGSTINSRKDVRRSLFWNEEDVIRKLEWQLKNKR